jgi:tetratricopeptide (TPR) repeat protein
LYEASLPYAGDVEAELERLAIDDRELYLAAVNALYFCYVPIGRPDAARTMLERTLSHVDDDAASVARYCYLLSMLHARFLQPTDQAKAESYLQRALDALQGADLPDDERHFLTVFTMNGLAFVRLRQGKAQEALELCRAGLARLNEHLDPERHRLHRSVLLFNIAQVHAQIGPYEDAIAYFSQAMEMDPNYSEYYNDRGTVYLKMERLEDAERDYLRAIELSPPYVEVWTNLGQCYRAMERMDDAIRAYSRALDLDRDCTLAVVGRADAQFALDRAALALEDYDRALAMEPDQPLVLASRAILHYEAGRLSNALADLDLAVKLAPEIAEFYQNRAVALQELGRRDEAVRDLATYLELSPDAEDRGDVEDSLALLSRGVQ